MKRVQLFEFEDFNWFPTKIRTAITNLIVVLMKMVGTEKVISKQLADVNKLHPFSRIVDMGSGSGGVMPMVQDELNQNREQKIELLLTDLHPNADLVRRFNTQSHEELRYSPDSLDATDLNETPEGLKTMINSFHHMPPEKAKKILKTAAENHQPLFIYELADNKMPLIVWWLLLPISLVILMIMTLFMTPFVKKMTWQQIVFTYIIPIIPIFYAWDGQASYPRTYSIKDVQRLIQDTPSEAYDWEVAPAKKANGKNAGYYILGLPK